MPETIATLSRSSDWRCRCRRLIANGNHSAGEVGIVVRFAFQRWNPYRARSGRLLLKSACMREASTRRYRNERPEGCCGPSATIRSFSVFWDGTGLDGWSFRVKSRSQTGWDSMTRTRVTLLSIQLVPPKPTGRSFIRRSWPLSQPQEATWWRPCSAASITKSATISWRIFQRRSSTESLPRVVHGEPLRYPSGRAETP